jgi:hypothetical protein
MKPPEPDFPSPIKRVAGRETALGTVRLSLGRNTTAAENACAAASLAAA